MSMFDDWLVFDSTAYNLIVNSGKWLWDTVNADNMIGIIISVFGSLMIVLALLAAAQQWRSE
jgi:hypothetical protein